MRRRVLGLAVGLLLALPVPALAAETNAAAAGNAKPSVAPAQTDQASRDDDAEQRGHVIPDEDASPRRDDSIPAPAPAPAPAPSTPSVSASPLRAQSPAAVASRRDELPRTGGEEGLLLLWFGGLLAGAGVCIRRAIA
ncbi:MAG TPA: LPXTG cell wall anchor domain-containing protein [Thermoleophilaceae bacterium]|nr:LPXTG cell wall anchor domain-containing protein [Thermoleophilaceae bacterium]